MTPWPLFWPGHFALHRSTCKFTSNHGTYLTAITIYIEALCAAACPQPEPNATELPSCARDSQLSASCTKTAAAVAWRGGGARRPGPEG